MQTNIEDTTLDELLSSLEPPYERPEHKTIGRTLDKYGIPFFYKQPILVYENGGYKTEYPAFWLPAYGGAIIDHIAGPSSELLSQKQSLYDRNQIPAVLITDQQLKSQNWQSNLYQKLDEIYRNASGFAPAGYK
ncbi:MAG: hypothetical protein Q7T18_11310 [Sedimentisphaerales bacterium]|nr:hypothetical protein [Sedimentisphaerales bacterium]